MQLSLVPSFASSPWVFYDLFGGKMGVLAPTPDLNYGCRSKFDRCCLVTNQNKQVYIYPIVHMKNVQIISLHIWYLATPGKDKRLHHHTYQDAHELVASALAESDDEPADAEPMPGGRRRLEDALTGWVCFSMLRTTGEPVIWLMSWGTAHISSSKCHQEVKVKLDV